MDLLGTLLIDAVRKSPSFAGVGFTHSIAPSSSSSSLASIGDLGVGDADVKASLTAAGGLTGCGLMISPLTMPAAVVDGDNCVAVAVAT